MDARPGRPRQSVSFRAEPPGRDRRASGANDLARLVTMGIDALRRRPETKRAGRWEGSRVDQVWLCGSCHSLNNASVKRCYKCRTERSAGEVVDQTGSVDAPG